MKINIWIDATFCPPNGYKFNEEGPSDPVKGLLDISLFHELAHAALFHEGIEFGEDENRVIGIEDIYRSQIPASRGRPRRARRTFGPKEGSDCSSASSSTEEKDPPEPNPGCGPGPWWRYREAVRNLRVNKFYGSLIYYSEKGHVSKAETAEVFDWDKDDENPAYPNGPYSIGQTSNTAKLAECQTRPWFNSLVLQVQAQAATDHGEMPPDPTDETLNIEASQECPNGCIIAEAHPEGAYSARLNELRFVRDNILRKTNWGSRIFSRFHNHYYTFSGTVAESIRKDPEMRESIGFMIASPLINYLRIVTNMPRFEKRELNTVPAPFRKILELISADLDAWLARIDVGSDLAKLDSEGAAIEIAIALRFRFRTETEREQYLRQLRNEGLIPLAGPLTDVHSTEALMRSLGASESEVRAVLYDRSHAMPSGKFESENA